LLKRKLEDGFSPKARVKLPIQLGANNIWDGWRLFAKAKRTSASLSLASRLRLLPRLRTTFAFAKQTQI
jgi:hypothetical protein